MTARLTYRILGRLEVWMPAGQEAGSWQPVTGPHATLLAMLLVNAGTTVKNARLIRALWPEPPRTATTQVYKHIQAIRELLGPAGRARCLVNEPEVGYRLMVADGELDAAEFQRLVRQAETRSRAGQTEAAVRHLQEALSLWRDSDPLHGIDSPLLEDATELLRHRRLRAAEHLFALALQRHDDELVVDLAPRLVEPDPTRERLWASWIIALYRSERRAQAIAACQSFDELSHLGHNPLRELGYAVGRGDTAAVEAYTRRLLPRRAAAADPLPLPAAIADLVGRGEQRELAGRLLTEPGLATGPVVLTGPPGAGKTVLAVHIAHQLRPRFPDGVRYLELRGTQPHPAGTEEVLVRLLRSLGAPAEEIPPGRADRLADYQHRLAGQRTLLVLDDAADAAGLADLLPRTGPAATLVTSQDRLDGLPGAHRIELAELPLREGVELFGRVAEAGGAELAGEDPAAIRRMVQEVCDGLPLAVRVAGALRAAYRHLSTSELTTLAVAGGVDALVYQDLDVPGAIAAGYQRLDGPARTLLRRLALLELPEFPPWVAAAVLDTAPAAAAHVLDRLCGRSLLQRRELGGAIPPRYGLPDLVRRYAQRLAEQQDDPHAVLARAYGCLLWLARDAHRRLFGGDFEVSHGDASIWRLPEAERDQLLVDPLTWYEQERANLRAAVVHAARTGHAALGWDLAISSHEFYAQRCWFDDWFETHTVARQACRSAGEIRGEAAMVTALCQPTLVNTGRRGLPEAADLAGAVEQFTAAGDRHGEAFARRTLGSAHRRTGAFAAARRQFALARERYHTCGDRFGAWQSTRLLGQTCLDLGDPDAALRHLTEARALARGLNHGRAVPQTEYWIAEALLARGETAAASIRLQRALAMAERAGDRAGTAYCRYGLGVVAHRAGRAAEAQRLLVEAGEAAREASDGVLQGRILVRLGELHRDREPAMAIRYLTEAAARFAGCQARWHQTQALRALGTLQRRSGASPSR